MPYQLQYQIGPVEKIEKICIEGYPTDDAKIDSFINDYFRSPQTADLPEWLNCKLSFDLESTPRIVTISNDTTSKSKTISLPSTLKDEELNNLRTSLAALKPPITVSGFRKLYIKNNLSFLKEMFMELGREYATHLANQDDITLIANYAHQGAIHQQGSVFISNEVVSDLEIETKPDTIQVKPDQYIIKYSRPLVYRKLDLETGIMDEPIKFTFNMEATIDRKTRKLTAAPFITVKFPRGTTAEQFNIVKAVLEKNYFKNKETVLFNNKKILGELYPTSPSLFNSRITQTRTSRILFGTAATILIAALITAVIIGILIATGGLGAIPLVAGIAAAVALKPAIVAAGGILVTGAVVASATAIAGVTQLQRTSIEPLSEPTLAADTPAYTTIDPLLAPSISQAHISAAPAPSSPTKTAGTPPFDLAADIISLKEGSHSVTDSFESKTTAGGDISPEDDDLDADQVSTTGEGIGR